MSAGLLQLPSHRSGAGSRLERGTWGTSLLSCSSLWRAQELQLRVGQARLACNTCQHLCGPGWRQDMLGQVSALTGMHESKDRVWVKCCWTSLEHLPVRTETVGESH